METRAFAALICSIVLASIPALAQEEDYTKPRNELTVQTTGNFVNGATCNGITERVDNGGGGLAGYRLCFNRYSGVELNCGNTEKYAATGVKTNSNEVSGAYVLRLPMKRLAPFALPGVSGMTFDPKNLHWGQHAGARRNGSMVHSFNRSRRADILSSAVSDSGSDTET